MELGSSLFSILLPPFIPTSLLLSMPLPHYLSVLSDHCCDYGCHAAVKRSTINRPEIKPKNEFPQCRPHALLSRNYLAGEWLITPLRRRRQKRRRRDDVWLRLAVMEATAGLRNRGWLVLQSNGNFTSVFFSFFFFLEELHTGTHKVHGVEILFNHSLKWKSMLRKLPGKYSRITTSRHREKCCVAFTAKFLKCNIMTVSNMLWHRPTKEMM